MESFLSFVGVMAGLALLDPEAMGLFLLSFLGAATLVALALRGFWWLGKRRGAA